jgi:hypothetical protein
MDSIGESMRTLNVGFAETALHTGRVTQTELDLARKAVRRPGGGATRERSIVEDTLRRNASQRDRVVWEGELVVPGRKLVIAHDPDNPRSETIRSLRTELLMRSSGRRYCRS